jgi:Flp pilus assembly pilin Flp
MLKRIWREDEGVLTFEWILLVTLLVISVVGGISGVRDAISLELGNVAGAIISVDQSYSVCSPIETKVGGGAGAPCCLQGAVGFKYAAAPRNITVVRIDGTTAQAPGACP